MECTTITPGAWGGFDHVHLTVIEMMQAAPVACIIKVRHCIYDASIVAFIIIKVLKRRNYDSGIVAQCFELTNYEASIVITTLNVRH